MTVETRYMRIDNWTVNGLSAYQLGTAQSGSGALIETGVALLSVQVWWGIRVWKRTSAGVETEITAGTPVAQVTRTVDGEGIQSATWACPATGLISTDAVVVRVYTKLGAAAWHDYWGIPKYITEQLGAQSLDAATWTVYLYTKRVFDPDPVWGGTFSYFYWGIAATDSRIGNFTWTLYVAPLAGLKRLLVGVGL